MNERLVIIAPSWESRARLHLRLSVEVNRKVMASAIISTADDSATLGDLLARLEDVAD